MQGYVPRYHRVYLVDDHNIVRRGLHDLLNGARDIEVVGDSGSAQDAAAEILRLEADVMLLDLQLQDGTGIEVCRAVRAVNPSVCGLLLTAAGDDEAAAAALLAGAAGYLVKMTRDGDIVGTIRMQRPGVSQLDGHVVQRASLLLGSVMDSLTPAATVAERQILQQVQDGLTDSDISKALTTEDTHDTDVVGFIARMTRALLGDGAPSAQPGAGRHRRTD